MKATPFLLLLLLATASVASAQVPSPKPPPATTTAPENVLVKSGESIAFMSFGLESSSEDTHFPPSNRIGIK